MIRLLLLVLLLAALAWIAWRVLRQALAPPPSGGEKQAFEPTGRCERCGTHVPRDQLDAAGACARCRATPA